ncbi:MAG TPA: DUF2141 domain-containing protein [Sphingomicrobium sp.]|jgi:uncharacterized protein (DUF2141 family)|nr:DUF2141 domain-containing protein [Sphingomicrobium sp.]
MTWRPLSLLLLLLLTAATQPAPSSTDLSVATQGLRNTRGVVHFCLTKAASRFMDCQKDPGSARLTVPAAQASRVAFHQVAAGTYALIAFHDENGNAKLDMTLGIPREGFAFSNNPTIRMRAPTYAEVKFDLLPGASTQAIRFRYVL